MTKKPTDVTRLLSDQVSAEEIVIIIQQLRGVLRRGIRGDVVEFGCYVGTTSVFLQQELIDISRKLHVYDSFAGLPAKREADISPAGEQFRPGELKATKKEFIKNFRKFNMPLPLIHKSWFSDLTESDLPDQIAFAFLDGDYYESILTPLRLIWPRLVQGAVVVIDDYINEQLPGVHAAVNTWAQHHQFQLKTEAGLAIMNV